MDGMHPAAMLARAVAAKHGKMEEGEGEGSGDMVKDHALHACGSLILHAIKENDPHLLMKALKHANPHFDDDSGIGPQMGPEDGV